jgi:hypothetical protein
MGGSSLPLLYVELFVFTFKLTLGALLVKDFGRYLMGDPDEFTGGRFEDALVGEITSLTGGLLSIAMELSTRPGISGGRNI